MKPLLLAILTAPALAVAAPTFHDWAATPPMGWNSWDCFGTGVNEALTKANADYMAGHLKPFGWQYIVVDIQWYQPTAAGWGYAPEPRLAMDEYGRLLPAENRFPSAAGNKGFKPLADYCHAKGLKFGVHLMRGIPRQAVALNVPILGTNHHAAEIANKNDRCPWNPDMWGVDTTKPGAREYYDSVLKLLAGWGVDFIKIDDLSAPYHAGEVEAIRSAIDKCGRPIVFSTSPGETPLAEGPKVSANANMWRISGDFWDDWNALKEQFERCHKWTPYRGPGHFPDADMLPLGAVRQPGGWTHFTPDEQRTLMTLWSISRSPLMFGGHLPGNDPATLALITNPEVIAVNQASSKGRQLFRNDDRIAWVADAPGGTDQYLALFNARDTPQFSTANAAFSSGMVTRKTPGHAADVEVDLQGARKLFLVVDDGGDTFDCDHVAWIEPRLVGPGGEKKLTELPWASATAGWGKAAINANASGGKLVVDKQPVAFGIGTHAPSVIEFDLPAGYTGFKARAGLEQGGVAQGRGATVRFYVVTTDPRPPGAAEGTPIPVEFAALGFAGPCRVRDLWQRADLGTHSERFSPTIKPHAAGLYRISGRQAVREQDNPGE